MSNLVYIKCYFCMKNANKNDLIDMNANTVQIYEESIDFRHLIFDTCSVQIDESELNYICMECNNNLVMFHMFKRDVKKYSDFRKYIDKLDVLAKLEKFLEMQDDVSQLCIVEDLNKWAITSEALHDAKDIEEIIEYDLDCNDQIIEEEMQFSEICYQEESQDKNTRLPLEFVKWMRDEVRTSEVRRGRKTVYKCSVCDISLHSTDSLLRHLRDIHILTDLKHEREMSSEQIESFHREIENSKTSSTNSNGFSWKCNRCNEVKSYGTEISFKLHLRGAHFKELMCDEIQPTWQCSYESTQDESIMSHSELEPSSTPKRRRLNTLNDLKQEQITWIREQVTKSVVMKGRKTLYKCSVCLVVLSTQASLVRHLRDLHIMKNAKDEKTILREQVSSSKLTIDTLDGKEIVWKCNSCEQDRVYKSEQAFKLHFRMTHIRSRKIDTMFISNCKTTTVKEDGVKEAWMCPECQRVFLHREGLRHHLKSIHANVDYQKGLKPAFAGVKNFSRLTDRLENRSLGKGENFCDECGVKFLTTKHHVRPKVHRDCHETFKALASVMPHYSCETCRMVFNSQSSLSHHLSVHETTENLQQIPTEGLITFGATFYKEAVGDADETCLDEAVWECGHCSARYFEENDCVAHQLLLHSTSIFCCVDQLEFVGVNGLSKFTHHMRNKHPELFPEINYPCGSCQKVFPTIYEKLSHQKICDLKKYECDYCGKRYSNKHQLQAHMLFELGISGYSCENCGKKCKTMSDLRIHYNIHTNVRPYQCSVCEKSFKTPGARSTHMERHTNENGISCELCGTRLANRTLYQRHKRFQHNQQFRESQYEKNSCSHCSKSFLRTAHFKQHMKQQHGIC